MTTEDSFLKDKIQSLERAEMRKATEFSAMDRLRLKLRINSTASVEKRVVSALKSILPWGEIKFAGDSDVSEKKYSLEFPSIKMLKNPTGRTRCHFYSLSEVQQPSIYLDAKIVPNQESRNLMVLSHDCTTVGSYCKFRQGDLRKMYG